MREVSFTGSVIHSVRTDGGDESVGASAGGLGSPHGPPPRIVARCTRDRPAALPPDVTARRTDGTADACGV